MGLVDAPDHQEAERGLEHCRMVQFLISLSKMVHFKYDQLLEAVELKNLNVCALCTPLVYFGLSAQAGLGRRSGSIVAQTVEKLK